MKRLLPFVAIVLVLAGCSAPGLSDEERREAFLEVVRVAPELSAAEDEGLIQVGETLCDVMDKADDGKGWEAAALVAEGAGISESSSPMVVAASVQAFCPSHVDEIPDEHLGS
ncbi:DUF732 domain-containing protein [Streptomyces sp. NPDC058650]|uniref:DUF732 domain-containing protein n=1 Tax=Streptomyces sp. NPDC058650 TaxID=3346575 RepID=UPI003661763B